MRLLFSFAVFLSLSVIHRWDFLARIWNWSTITKIGQASSDAALQDTILGGSCFPAYCMGRCRLCSCTCQPVKEPKCMRRGESRSGAKWIGWSIYLCRGLHHHLFGYAIRQYLWSGQLLASSASRCHWHCYFTVHRTAGNGRTPNRAIDIEKSSLPIMCTILDILCDRRQFVHHQASRI